MRSWCSQLHLMKTDPVQMSWRFVASQSVVGVSSCVYLVCNSDHHVEEISYSVFDLK